MPEQINNFSDAEFMTADEKHKVIKDWKKFLHSGFARQQFTKRLYEHLHLHCGFIAHYNINGFYGEYLMRGEDQLRFIEMFDRSKYDSWRTLFHFLATTEDYKDINENMVQIGEKYIPVLASAARAGQKEYELSIAEALLQRNGLTLESVNEYQPPIIRREKPREIVQESLF